MPSIPVMSLSVGGPRIFMSDTKCEIAPILARARHEIAGNEKFYSCAFDLSGIAKFSHEGMPSSSYIEEQE